MKLFVEPMAATLVEVDGEGRVRFEKEGWSTPTLQEQRAIIYAAQNELADLTELLEKLEELQNGRIAGLNPAINSAILPSCHPAILLTASVDDDRPGPRRAPPRSPSLR